MVGGHNKVLGYTASRDITVRFASYIVGSIRIRPIRSLVLPGSQRGVQLVIVGPFLRIDQIDVSGEYEIPQTYISSTFAPEKQNQLATSLRSNISI